MSMRFVRSVSAVTVVALLSASCAEVARITTEPEGADIFVNGILVGESPQNFPYRSGLPGHFFVKVQKEGYKEIKDARIERVYRADVSLALLILGIFPYFFSARLEDQYLFTLQQENPLE